MKKPSFFKKYAYGWVTLLLLIFSLLGHWTAAWFAYVQESQEHNQPVEVGNYVVEVARDTFENWQSEFLQLIWQVVGLAFLWQVGSPQSKDGDDRKEAKIDEILRLVDKKGGNKFIQALDKKYPRV